jgi:hypothetical protein
VVSGQTRSRVVYYDRLLGGGVIPAGQSFFVQTFQSSPSLVVKEAAKVGKIDPAVTDPVQHLVISLKQGDIIDPAYVIFTEQATDGYDAQFDGRKFENYGMMNFSSMANDTVPLAVNNVSNAFCTKTVKLNVQDAPAGSYSLAFGNLQSLDDIGSIVLTDNFAGTTTSVTGTDYNFSISADPNSFGVGRFSITFTKLALDVSTPKMQAADVCPPGPGSVSITNSQTGVSYYIINSSGEIISVAGEGNGETITLDLLAGKLSAGPNTIRLSGGLLGCDRQIFPGDAIINFSNEVAVNTETDVSVCEGADATLTASGAPSGGYYRWFDSDGVIIEDATGPTFVVSEVLTESVFYVGVGHPDGCESALKEIHIYADTVDMPVILIKDDTLYTDVAGYYQWQKDGTAIPGANLNYYKPTGDGSYTVIASNGGCYKESSPYVVGDGDGDPVTGIEGGFNPEFVMDIYPVPSNGHSLHVKIHTPKTEPVLIEVIDMLGRLHFSQSIQVDALANGVEIVPNSPLYNGLYIVRATQGEIKEGRRVVVKQ